MNCEIPDVQAEFRKGRGTRGQIANICWIIEKAREFQRNIYFCFIGYAKAFDCMDHNKLWKILKEMGMPEHLTCLLRSPYVGQEATVRTRHETTDWFQIRKGIRQGCIVSPCLFNFYGENRAIICHYCLCIYQNFYNLSFNTENECGRNGLIFNRKGGFFFSR